VTIPGARRIDPDEEAARLARQRLDPPGREWAVRHPGGKVTVRIDGHAFPGRTSADDERIALDGDCEWCDGGTHALVCRDRQPWRGP
jgi:hypothetical protein